MNKGFSLIELLVVVAIIGILSAAGVAAYNGFIDSSRSSCAMMNHENMVEVSQTTQITCSMQSSITLLDKRGNQVSRSCSQPPNQWDGYMRDHFVGSGYKSCDGQNTPMPIGKFHGNPPVGQSYYAADNTANWPFYIKTCFSINNCQQNIVYWAP